jgi:hypothetical protein
MRLTSLALVALTVFPSILLTVCLAGLVRLDVWRRFRFFLAYVLFEIAQTLLFVCMSFLFSPSVSTLTSYRWIAVGAKGINAVLGLAVCYEIANELFISRASEAHIPRSLMRWCAALFLLASAVISALLSSSAADRIISTFQILDFSANLVKMGLLFTLVLFAAALNISWRSLPAGIALGFAVSAAGEMAGSSLLSVLGRSGILTSDFVRMGTFNVCVLIWLVYVLRREKPREFTGTGLQLSELEVLDQQMQRMIRP